MDAPAISYITVDEVQNQTLIDALAALDDGDIEILIQTAEDQIDVYVGPQEHHPDDDNIERVFPRLMDFDRDTGVPVVPYRVSRACLRQVEWLYLQWWPNSGTDELPVEQTVESENIGGDGSYSAKYTGVGVDLAEATLGLQAKSMLKGFVSRMAAMSLTDPDDVPPRDVSFDSMLPDRCTIYKRTLATSGKVNAESWVAQPQTRCRVLKNSAALFNAEKAQHVTIVRTRFVLRQGENVAMRDRINHEGRMYEVVEVVTTWTRRRHHKIAICEIPAGRT